MSWWAATIVGAASGVLASMGLGGGFILVVYLALCTDIAQRSAQGINLLFFIPIIIIAVVLHIKNKLIDVRLALSCSAVGAAAAVAGFFAAQAVEETALRTAFAIFIILAGLKDLFAKGVDKE
ncbi:MAG: TSUP family transporter [Oscillospiraceae bacterium]